MIVCRPTWLSALALWCILAPVTAAAASDAPDTRLWYSAAPGHVWVIATTGACVRSYSISAESLQAHVGGENIILRFDRARSSLRLVTTGGTATRAVREAAWRGDPGLAQIRPLLAADYGLFRHAAAGHPALKPLVHALELALSGSVVAATGGESDTSFALLDRALERLPERRRTATLRPDFDHAAAVAGIEVEITRAPRRDSPSRP